MERSRFRTLLGLALLVVGVIWLSSALTRSMAPPRPMPAMPEMPAVPAVPAPPTPPAVPALPALPQAPAVPAIPAPPAPPAPGFHGFWLNPAVIVLALVALLLWRRNRAPRERPLA